MSSPDLRVDRPALDAGRLRTLAGPFWREITTVAETGSTNADLVVAARSGAPEGTVLLADRQTSGRGRLDRTWTSPPRAGIACSVLLRPGMSRSISAGYAVSGVDWPRAPMAAYPWLPLLAGVALVDAVRRVTGVAAALKWPNDLLVGPAGDRPVGKAAGILADVVDGAVVLGIGLNVTLRRDELPHDRASSLALAGAEDPDRTKLVAALLDALATWYGRWRSEGGDATRSGLHAAYRSRCDTLNRPVRVDLPDGSALMGNAVGVDAGGRLLVDVAAGAPVPVAAGDVVHAQFEPEPAAS